MPIVSGIPILSGLELRLFIAHGYPCMSRLRKADEGVLYDDSWKNRARETLYSGCLLTLLDTKKRATKVAIKLTPARAILTGDFFRSFGFRPGRRGN